VNLGFFSEYEEANGKEARERLTMYRNTKPFRET
jgi:hypothetical protein